MAIRRIDVTPEELPPAKLYLDDIEDITRVLELEEEDDVQTLYWVGEQACESIDDLQKIGNRVTYFKIETRHLHLKHKLRDLVITPGSTILHQHGSMPIAEWARYAQVRQIFERHPLRWKRLVQSIFQLIPWIVLLAFYLKLFAPAVDPIPGAIVISICAMALIYFAMFERSVVVLRYSYEARFPKLREHAPQFVIALTSTIVGAMLTVLFRRR